MLNLIKIKQKEMMGKDDLKLYLQLYFGCQSAIFYSLIVLMKFNCTVQ